jgi:lysophospholipase L1-like esterase
MDCKIYIAPNSTRKIMVPSGAVLEVSAGAQINAGGEAFESSSPFTSVLGKGDYVFISASEQQVVANYTPLAPISRNVQNSRKVLYVGDSILALAEGVISATSVVSIGNNLARVTASSHANSVGDTIRIGGAPTRALNAMEARVTAVESANEFLVDLGKLKHDVTSASTPTMYWTARRSCRGILTGVETLIGEHFDTTWCAMGGATAQQVLDLALEAVTEQHSIAIVCAGMNNVYSVNQSYDVAWSEIRSLMNFAASVADVVVVITIPPRDSAGGVWTVEKQAIHTRLNRAIYDECAAKQHQFINSWASVGNGVTYVNPAAANPDPAAVMSFDGTHPSFVGNYAIARDIVEKIKPFIGISNGYRGAHLAMIDAQSNNILTNANFAASAAGVATGWANTNVTAGVSLTPTIVARSVAADGDALGNNQVLTFNYGSATGTATFRYARSSSIHTLLTPGRKFRARIPFKLTGSLGIIGLDLLVQGVLPGQSWFLYANSQESNADPYVGDLSGWLETVTRVIPAGLTGCTPFVRVTFTSAQTTNAVLTLFHPVFEVFD